MSWLLHKSVPSFGIFQSQVQLGSCCGTMALSLPLHPWGLFQFHCRGPLPWCFTPSDAGGYTPRWGRSGSAFFGAKEWKTFGNSKKFPDRDMIILRLHPGWSITNSFKRLQSIILNPEVVESVTEIKLLKLLRRAVSF